MTPEQQLRDEFRATVIPWLGEFSWQHGSARHYRKMIIDGKGEIIDNERKAIREAK